MSNASLLSPNVVSRENWKAARKALLLKEKEFTKQRDALAAERLAMPMVKIDKEYSFDAPAGKKSLADLFEGRSQLIVYHFMFDPAEPPPGKAEPFSEGCSGCSVIGDSIGPIEHFHARDTSITMVSRAPLSKIEPFKKRMGWTMPWVSSHGSDFNYDFHVTIDENVAPIEYNYMDKAELEAKGHLYHIHGEQPGMSAFLRADDGMIYHSYSTYGRGLDALMSYYHWLELTPFGRGEGWGGQPNVDGKGLGWLKHHDKYGAKRDDGCCCH